MLTVSTAKEATVFTRMSAIKLFVSLLVILFFSGCMAGRASRSFENAGTVSTQRTGGQNVSKSDTLAADNKSLPSAEIQEEGKQSESIKLVSH
ncbi:MAG: hypothetical protein Q4G59_11510, partial [Planctomycetia bacterium]|nr:hypothetical protein [Planctomycetia bacterium]